LKPRTWRLLETLRGSAASLAPIFRSRKGGGRLDPSSQVRRILYTAAKRAGLERKVSPHWLRHYLPFRTMSG